LPRLWHQVPSSPAPDELDAVIGVRMERQAVLTAEQPPDLWAIVHESVLRHTIGDRQVMRQQFERILDVAELENVTVQVLPFDAGTYPATGAFTILGFPEQEDPDVVYRDGLTDAVYLEHSADIARYTRAFDNLRALALSPQRSIEMINDLI
jgi:hypothetical protein